jgi:hypothetical protein
MAHQREMDEYARMNAIQNKQEQQIAHLQVTITMFELL